VRVCSSLSEMCVSCVFFSFHRADLARCVPCLPFYSLQGEGSGYICGKKVKWEKDEREIQKKVVPSMVVFLLIRCEQLPL
jgi:hypothetical protein